jgi:hypothetical protein
MSTYFEYTSPNKRYTQLPQGFEGHLSVEAIENLSKTLDCPLSHEIFDKISHKNFNFVSTFFLLELVYNRSGGSILIDWSYPFFFKKNSIIVKENVQPWLTLRTR